MDVLFAGKKAKMSIGKNQSSTTKDIMFSGVIDNPLKTAFTFNIDEESKLVRTERDINLETTDEEIFDKVREEWNL